LRRQLFLGQRCGKFSRSAHQRTMPMRARSTSSGDSDAISRSIISASVSISFGIEFSLLLAARHAPEVCFVFSLRREERGRRARRRDRSVCARLLAKSGAFRRAVRRSPSASGRALQVPVVFDPRFAVSGESLANAPAPVATLLAGSSYWLPGG